MARFYAPRPRPGGWPTISPPSTAPSLGDGVAFAVLAGAGLMALADAGRR
jgi:hypothetical protein